MAILCNKTRFCVHVITRMNNASYNNGNPRISFAKLPPSSTIIPTEESVHLGCRLWWVHLYFLDPTTLLKSNLHPEVFQTRIPDWTIGLVLKMNLEGRGQIHFPHHAFYPFVWTFSFSTVYVFLQEKDANFGKMERAIHRLHSC